MGQQLTNLQRRLRRNQRVRPMTEQEERLRPERERVTARRIQLSALRDFLRTPRQRVNEPNQLEVRHELSDLQNQLRQRELSIATLEEQLRAEQQQVRELRNQLSTKEGELISLRELLANTVTPLSNTNGERVRAPEPERPRTSTVRRTRTGGPTNSFSRGQRSRSARQTVVGPRSQLRTNDQDARTMTEQISEPQQRVNDNPPDWVINRNAREFQITRNRELGRGAWGVVYPGTFCRCDVAVKEMHEEINSPENRASFEQEVYIAARCRHPCLLQFIGATTDGMRPLLVTELMDCTLRGRLYNQREQALCETEIVVISMDVALALNYLHQKRPSPIIHSDISTANVLLWRQGSQWRGKVSDYGTANFVRARNNPGAIIYSAPEYLDEARNQLASCKVDVYSFGVLLCEMSIREMPDPQRRESQIARMTNLELMNLASTCTLQEPGGRPNMEEIIDELKSI